MTVKIIGSDKLIRALKQFPGKLNDEMAQQLEKAGDEILDEAKRLAPVRTGALRDSIKRRSRRRGMKTTVRVFCDYPKTGKRHKTSTKKQVKGKRDYYAFAVEYGTKHMQAQPFFMPAVRKIKAGLIPRMKNTLESAMEKNFK